MIFSPAAPRLKMSFANKRQEVDLPISDRIGCLVSSNDSHKNDSEMPSECDESGFASKIPHQSAREDSSKLKCEFCNTKFNPTAMKSFLSHLTKTKCQSCSEEFDCLNKLSTHRRWHCRNFDENRPRRKYQNKKQWCDLCSRYLICRRKYLQEEHKMERKCKKCNLTFACCGLATAHKSNCEGGEKKKKLSSIPKEQNSCTHCKKIYKSERLHFEEKSRSCQNCGEKFDCGGLRSQHEANCLISCTFCGQLLTKQTQETHKRERRCANCSHVSQCFNLFSQHECSEASDAEMEVPKEPEEKSVDTDIKIVKIGSVNSKGFYEEPVKPLVLKKCQFCQIICNSEENFECHTRETDCPRCGFAQPCNTLLAHHLDLCRFEKEKAEVFRCGECDKVFEKKGKLESHKRRRHTRSRINAEAILAMMVEKKLSEAQRFFVGASFVKHETIDIS
ncbi:zinc finger protein 429-like [Neocloeon triangulifer]|uniref:zinc finger protein 429-like n=1 Tax=Neocloeon triangulifer TaxID=2078957 RepID=UPI00286EE4A6|nr:zinc finger protein 429-like [Neocloeon triangulifer]